MVGLQGLGLGLQGSMAYRHFEYKVLSVQGRMVEVLG